MNSVFKPLVIIPTYNEVENVKILLPEILKLNPQVEILVVDDNSPDGTGKCIEEIKATEAKIHLLSRPGKQGLGKAYIAGFRWGLHHGYSHLIEMDADFSHRPVDLQKIVEALKTQDFVVGSRYIPGGSTVNWGLIRKIISKGGSFYSRVILGYPLNDWTGGFNGWRKDVLESIQLDKVFSEGYSFQIELKYRALKRGFNGLEVPITFEDRRIGQSKMAFRIVIEAFWKVWKLRWVV